jgi:hypothetical protein
MKIHDTTGLPNPALSCVLSEWQDGRADARLTVAIKNHAIRWTLLRKQD